MPKTKKRFGLILVFCFACAVLVDSAPIDLLKRLGPSSDGWDRLHPELQRLLVEYPSLHRLEVNKGENGRFVYAKADAHGIGNRVNCVIGAFVVALLTNRALIIEWDSRAGCTSLEMTKIDRHGRNRTRGTSVNGVNDLVCDPVRIDDLFDAPDDIDWRGTSLPSGMTVEERCPGKGTVSPPGTHWIMRTNADMYNFRGLFDADYYDFHKEATVLCVRSDRPFFWATTCNPRKKYMFPDPWSAFGALQQYLLAPAQSIRDRVQAQLKSMSCLAGVHLRKVREKDEVSVAIINSLASLTRRNGSGVFIASDPFSLEAKREIAEMVLKQDLGLIEIQSLSPHPTRTTLEGVLDAGVENTFLGFCDRVYPFKSGKSTFHDIAVARLVWRHGLSTEATSLMLGPTENNAHEDMVAPSAECYYPWHRETTLLN